MTHVVTEACIKCRYTDCVAVCPVDCFHEGMNMLVIDPEECIDCGACVDECPVHAIFPEEDLPEAYHDYLQLNVEYSTKWPLITEGQESLDTAEEFKDVEHKRDLFDPTPAPRDDE
ncbi:MAG: ferredoxin family protein [Candidatus Hydrogenedentota bacterium]